MIKKIDNAYFSFFIATVLSLLVAGMVVSDVAPAYELVGWEHGATGYELAFEAAKEKESPMLVFFNLDSSELCERLKNEYFGVLKVYEFLVDIPKVEIDLDGSDLEKSIAAQYGVEQDPSLFVIFPIFEMESQGVTPFLEDHDMTVDEFIQNLRNIFILGYSGSAYQYFEDEDHENALKYFEIARDLDPERAYPYFAIGSIYHTKAIEEGDAEYVNMAEENYLKALELDPDFKESRKELERLRKELGED